MIATIAGVVTWTTLTLLGVPFAIVLALLVAFFDLIPLVGATVGAILAVAVAFTHSTSAGVTMLVVHLVYQQVENHVLQPMVARRSVDVSPVVVILSVLAGATLLGVLGALLAIPIAGSIQVALSETIEERRRTIAERRAALLAAGEGSAPPRAVRLKAAAQAPPAGAGLRPPRSHQAIVPAASTSTPPTSDRSGRLAARSRQPPSPSSGRPGARVLPGPRVSADALAIA